jgi:RHH-type proline utilization regulon transcriptional repressor/proline dehydrogenase/delta 1-pyrroline-5-carboxylate dehydrogenase
MAVEQVMEGAAEVEGAVQARGRELLGAVRPERLIALTPGWWQERLMEWASSDPQFRAKLLRFVDVLPALRTPASVADHVKQYFRGDVHLPVRVGSAVAASGAFRPALSKVVRQGVFAMADRFIGGDSPEDALPKLRELVSGGTAYTIDLLGEATLSEAEADEYLRRYMELIEVLSRDAGRQGGPPDVRKPNISVKLSALTSHFEAAAPEATSRAVMKRLEPLLRAARQRSVFVNVDMEQFRYKDLTHRIFEEAVLSPAFRDWGDVGIVVQAYLKDASEDIAGLRALAERRGTPITVRLVKGAYWDEETIVAVQEARQAPVFEQKEATDLNFERSTQLLVDAYPHLQPAFGTHNPRSITQAMIRAERAGVPEEQVEFQMLYGMAEGLRKAVQSMGYRTRVYVPAGEIVPGMAYLVRRLLENTSNESWLMHRHEEGEPEDLLRAPVVAAQEHRAATGFRNEPPAEFHLPGPRQAMEKAIEAMRASFGRDYALSIGNVDETTGDWEEIRYPADTGVVGRVARAGVSHARVAVEEARAAWPGWRDTGAAARAATLRRAADLMAERRFEFAATMVFESGKPWREADGDVIEAIDYLRYYAAEAERLAAGEPVLRLPGEDNRYVYEPRGVAVVIAPWNFPLAIITGMSTAALAAGCTAILKPAEQSPIVARKLVDVLHAAGVPRGAVQFVPGRGEVIGAELVEHPGVDVIAFTGSNGVGLQILTSAAKVRPGQRNVKKVIAEMGGKNAIIVDDDADLDQAVDGTLVSAFGYAGQKCSAASRVIVVGSAYEEFRRRLAAGVESLVVGRPHDPHTFVPPVISAEARARIEEYVAIGEREGVVVARGARGEGLGHYVAPVVLEHIPLTSRVTEDEIFGPVLAMYRTANFDEALRMAMDSPFALTGGLYSRNPGHIARARGDFRVGNLYINRKITGAIVGRQPFGGLAMSGVGDKAGGPAYLQQFMAPRVVTENTVRRGFAPEEVARWGDCGLQVGGAGVGGDT